jgi:Domain of unknown function (DUF4136)
MRFVSLSLLLPLSLIAAAVGCSAMRPAPPAAPQAAPEAFTRHRAFAFSLPGQPPAGYDATALSREAERRARGAIVAALVRKGYVEDGARADFVVRVSSGARDVPAGDGETGYHPPQPEEVNVTIDLFDGASGAPLWHAVAIAGADAPEIDDAQLQDAVSGAFAAIPAQSSASIASAEKSGSADRVYP